MIEIVFEKCASFSFSFFDIKISKMSKLNISAKVLMTPYKSFLTCSGYFIARSPRAQQQLLHTLIFLKSAGSLISNSFIEALSFYFNYKSSSGTCFSKILKGISDKISIYTFSEFSTTFKLFDYIITN